ncbi:terminase TerL endonuclease subunit [Mesorhizobium sp. M0771]|uniref:terminase large subunit n=1 Tax=Mesorhizobium sp. M0771 TaxID=2956997 RepID=UPI0033360BA9
MTIRSTFPEWIYDGSPIDDPLGHGDRAVRFLRALKHPKSRAMKRAFQLDDWQERIVRKIYGPRDEQGKRIVSTVVLLLPRGNRKTSLAAALSLLHTIGPERVPGGEAIFAASDRNQASIGFREALSIVRADKRISAAVKVSDATNSAKSITFKNDGTRLETISADGNRQHGRTPNFVLVDELHIWRGRDLWDALQTGLDKTDDALLVVASTAGRGQDNIAWEIVEDARKVARGDVVDPTILPILFEADRDSDWRDEAIWRRINPGLAHGYPSLAGFRRHADRAERSVSERESLRQLKLNIWLDRSTDPFVDMAVYDQGNAPIDLEALRGRPCWLAVDLSSTTDLTTIVAAWRDDAGGYIVVPWFFCPGESLRRRAEIDGVPYTLWRDNGLISATPGNVVDYDYVEQRIRDLCDEFDVQEIAFDPHLARQTITRLIADGLPAVEMRQGWVTMAPAIKELERAIIAGKFQHGGHPVLRWNFSNIAVETDKAGNQTFHKGKSTDRIDGAQAAAMAVGRAFVGETNVSAYNAPESTGLFIFH